MKPRPEQNPFLNEFARLRPKNMSLDTDNAASAPPSLWFKRPLVWVLVAALIGGGVWWKRHQNATQTVREEAQTQGGPSAGGGRRGGKGGMPDRPMPVIVAPATQRDVGIYLNGLGTVTARNTVTVKPRVDGELIRLNVREGEVVSAGQLLAEIDPRPFEIQLAQAEGQLQRDQALLKNARLDLERYRTLVAQDSGTRQQLDTQEALVRQYEGTVKSDQSQVDNARLQLTYARVVAPIGGRLGLRQVDVGNVVRASDANGLVVITQVQPINTLFTLPEKDIGAVLAKFHAGETLSVEALDRDQKSVLATGRLTAVDNQIDTTTGTLKLKAEFPNTDNVLFPNQFVNIRLKVAVQPKATVIPAAAVQRGAPGIYVYVVKADKTVAVRVVTPGVVEREQVVIDKGLEVGEQIVIDGVDKLRDGAKVEPVTREAAARAMQGRPKAGGSTPAASASGPAADDRGESGRRRQSQDGAQ